jgi:hypothetical protein
MANNKYHDNHGLTPAEQEQLRHLPSGRQLGGTGEYVSPYTKQVPRSKLKPGRAYDKSAPAVHARERLKGEERGDHVESEVLGDSYESNTGVHVSHQNKHARPKR